MYLYAYMALLKPIYGKTPMELVAEGNLMTPEDHIENIRGAKGQIKYALA